MSDEDSRRQQEEQRRRQEALRLRWEQTQKYWKDRLDDLDTDLDNWSLKVNTASQHDGSAAAQANPQLRAYSQGKAARVRGLAGVAFADLRQKHHQFAIAIDQLQYRDNIFDDRQEEKRVRISTAINREADRLGLPPLR